LASRPINFYISCKGRAEPAEIGDACHRDLIAARQPIRLYQEALIVPIGAESALFPAQSGLLNESGRADVESIERALTINSRVIERTVL